MEDKKMRLFDLVEELRKAEAELDFDPETGEVINGDVFDKISVDIDTKLEGIGCIVKEERAMAKSIAEEIKSAQARKKSHESRADWLENYATTNMVALGKKKFETAKCQLTVKETERTIAPEEVIPDLAEEFVNVKVERKANLTAIKAAIKSGIKVAGCYIEKHLSCNIK